MDMYQKRKTRQEKNMKKSEEEVNNKMNINCLTTVLPILLKNSIK